jgi:prepilin-type processing-associated H-X9-DG protein
MPSLTKNRRGLTLIELLVILAVIVFLLGFLLPALARVRSAAARTQSVNNLKQLGLAAHSFHDVNKGFPPGVGPAPQLGPSHGTAHFYLLPYLEQDNLFKRAEGFSWKNGVSSVPLPVFVSPLDKSAPPDGKYKNWLATTNYAANWLVFGKGGTSIVRIADGTSQTLMFAERSQLCSGHPCAWGYSSLYYWAPLFAYYSKGRFQTMHGADGCDPALAQALDGAGINAAFCDGSVHYLTDRLSPRAWLLLSEPADGNPIGEDF